MHFLELSDDVLSQVFERLDFWALASCEQTCRAIHQLLEQNVRLRYIKESQRRSKSPIMNTPLSAKEHLDSLLRHDCAWRTLPDTLAIPPTHEAVLTTLPDYDDMMQSWITDRALYVLLDRRHLTVARFDFASGELQDPFIEERDIVLSFQQGQILSMVIDEDQGVLVITHKTGGIWLFVRFYSSVNGQPHPEANSNLNPRLLSESLSASNLPPTVHGSKIAIPYTKAGMRGIAAVDWKSGQDLQIFPPFSRFFEFLTPIVILSTNKRTLHFLRLFPQKDVQFSLGMPDLRPWNSIRILRPNVRPSLVPSSTDPRSIDSPFLTIRLHSFYFHEETLSQRWYLLIDRRSLLTNLHLFAVVTPNRYVVPWVQWSAVIPTAILGPFPLTSGAPLAVTMGNRLLLPEYLPSGDVLHIYEFLPPRMGEGVSSSLPDGTDTSLSMHGPTKEIPFTRQTYNLPRRNGKYIFGSRHVIHVERHSGSTRDNLKIWRLY